MNQFDSTTWGDFPSIEPLVVSTGDFSNQLRTGYILVTGATGFVGQYLLKDLFDAGQRLAVLVRPNKRQSAEDRIETIMRRWEQELGKPMPRPIVLNGHLKDPDLGLSRTDREWIKQHCQRIIHNAAVLKFDSCHRQGEPWQTNLVGTQHVVDFARRSDIEEFHHVSTAYVSGICERTFYENDLQLGQSFRNEYEESKYEAEKIIRAAEGFESKTIYRPAVIVGDSNSGFTCSYHGLYLYLRLMATLIPEQEKDDSGWFRTPIQLPMTGDEPRNLVPVDWVSRMIARLVCYPSAHNQTFHLTPDHGLTAKQLIDYCCDYFHSTGVEFGRPSSTETAKTDFADRFLENVQVYSSYDTSDPVFDKSNVEHFCSDDRCPEISREMIYRFLDYGIADNWGRKRKPEFQAENWMAQNTNLIIQAAAECHPVIPHQFGLDLVGPGGGQWVVNVSPTDTTSRIQRGLPDHGQPILQVDVEQFDQWSGDQDAVSFWKKVLVELSRFEQSDLRLKLLDC